MSRKCRNGAEKPCRLAYGLRGFLRGFLHREVLECDVHRFDALDVHTGCRRLSPGHQRLALGVLGFKVCHGKVARPLKRKRFVGLEIHFALYVGCAFGELSPCKRLDPRIEGCKMQTLHVGRCVDSQGKNRELA